MEQVLVATALLVNIAACAVAIAFPPAGALAGLILACSSAVIGLLTLPGVLDDPNIKDALEVVDGLKAISEDVGCVLGSPVAVLIQCFAAAIDTFKLAAPGISDLTDSLAEALEELLKPDPAEPNPATGLFRGSFVATGSFSSGPCVWSVKEDWKDVQLSITPDRGGYRGYMWAALRFERGTLVSGPSSCPIPLWSRSGPRIGF